MRFKTTQYDETTGKNEKKANPEMVGCSAVQEISAGLDRSASSTVTTQQ
ncbi:hypothetical protein JCM19238_4942 [Vibrio ponticus]|nr:hypothetical protein JCM19238_4942 [Vibrio ponticus]